MSLSGGEDCKSSKQRKEKSTGARLISKPNNNPESKSAEKISDSYCGKRNSPQFSDDVNVIHLGIERKKRNLQSTGVGARIDACTNSPVGGSDVFAEVINFPEVPEYRASIEIDDFHCLKMLHSSTDIELVMDKVRAILGQQFGDRTVQRHNRFFIIQHQNIEMLIAGLLRAQFYCYKIDLPESNVFGEVTEQAGLALTWGVGRNMAQAQAERLKKKRHKLHRRRLKQRKNPQQPG